MVRKGSRAVQQLPASADAFVWLRLYQQDLHGRASRVGRTQPLWWTLRRPHRPLTYHAAHRMFERANAALGADWTLHDLRHSAATRMAHDPQLTLSDVQWVMGHAHLTTTELYLTPTKDEVVAGGAGSSRARPPTRRTPVPATAGAGLRPAVAERAVRQGAVTTSSSMWRANRSAVANATPPQAAGAEQAAARPVSRRRPASSGGRTPRDREDTAASADLPAVSSRRRTPPGPVGGAA